MSTVQLSWLNVITQHQSKSWEQSSFCLFPGKGEKGLFLTSCFAGSDHTLDCSVRTAKNSFVVVVAEGVFVKDKNTNKTKAECFITLK